MLQFALALGAPGVVLETLAYADSSFVTELRERLRYGTDRGLATESA
ncbi:hypothetical protein [Amycolatopsis keratiniphila]|nr:hypothetical protein [Amycolatopsis keratiniphila]